MKENPFKIENLIIIGSGPAGLTASIYASRAGLKPFVIEGSVFGGQLMWTSKVENFPGFPKGIMGPDLMINMKKQAENHGARFIGGNVTKVDFKSKPFKIWLGDAEYRANSVIIATGAKAKWLDIESAERLRGRGVSACATCDGPFFKDKDVVVVGGGNAAMEEALYLTKYANTVYLVHRSENFKTSKIMLERVKSNLSIKFVVNSEIVDVLGDRFVDGVTVLNKVKNTKTRLKVQGVFIAIGHIPDTSIFKDQIDLDLEGYVVISDKTKSSVDGVFIAGDVGDYRYRQAVTAAGFGCMAALDAEKFLHN